MGTMRLPVLESVRVASPCSANWDEMAGDGPVRFCGQCEKNVYNLSEMSRAEGEALVAAQEETMCVRLYRRADGTVLTSDCPVGVEKLRLRARLWAWARGAAASLSLLVGLGFGGRARADLAVRDGKPTAQVKNAPHVAMGGAPAPNPPRKLMGKMIAPPTPPKKIEPVIEAEMGDMLAPARKDKDSK